MQGLALVVMIGRFSGAEWENKKAKFFWRARRRGAASARVGTSGTRARGRVSYMYTIRGVLRLHGSILKYTEVYVKLAELKRRRAEPSGEWQTLYERGDVCLTPRRACDWI